MEFIVSSNKKNASWREIKKFEKEFSDYCNFMGYCPMIIYRPVNDGLGLNIAMHIGKGVNIPYINGKDFIKSIERVFPNYSFKIIN